LRVDLVAWTNTCYSIYIYNLTLQDINEFLLKYHLLHQFAFIGFFRFFEEVRLMDTINNNTLSLINFSN